VLRNRTFDELQIGETATIERTVTKQDLALFAIISGDSNPQHLDADFAASTRFHGVIAHGMLGGALISAVLGTRLPGPGTVYLGQSLRFLAPVHIGDVLRIEVKVLEKEPLKRKVTLQCRCLRQDDVVVIDGQATVLAPDEHIERPRTALPEVRLQEGEGALSRLFSAVLPMSRRERPERPWVDLFQSSMPSSTASD
jgi:phosphate acetyltransferase/phosphate butyryltransferase